MGYKTISEDKVKQLRNGESASYLDANNQVTDICSWARYKHSYFEDIAESDENYADPLLVFTVKVNFLPSKPVYIDIDSFRELLLSTVTKYDHPQARALKDEILDLLIHYRSKS